MPPGLLPASDNRVSVYLGSPLRPGCDPSFLVFAEISRALDYAIHGRERRLGLCEHQLFLRDHHEISHERICQTKVLVAGKNPERIFLALKGGQGLRHRQRGVDLSVNHLVHSLSRRAALNPAYPSLGIDSVLAKKWDESKVVRGPSCGDANPSALHLVYVVERE